MMAFETNTAELRKQISALKLSLEEERLPLESVWRDIRLHIEPALGKALVEGNLAQLAANRDDSKIYNSEPRLLLQRLSAGLQSGITNPARQWFKLGSGEPRIGSARSVRSWLDYATECLHDQFRKSNIYMALNLMYMHLGLFGTSCGLLTMVGSLPYLRIYDEGAYWIEENTNGRVDVCLLRMDMRPNQLVSEFGEEWLPEGLRTGNDTYTVWCMIFHRDRFDSGISSTDVHPDMEFVSVYFIDAQDVNNGVIAIRGHRFNPIIAPRWQQGTNAYGVGCGYIALADCKELQSMELDRLRGVKTVVDPPLLAPTSMKGEPIRSNPGGVTYYNDMGTSTKAPVTPLFSVPLNVAKIDQSIDIVVSRIRRLFYADLFAMLMNISSQQRQMTATQVSELAGEKVALLGPVLTRMDTDLLNPLVDGVWTGTIESALEAYPRLAEPPAGLAGTGLKVEYISSLHMEQKSVSRINGVNSLMSVVTPIAQFNPEVLDKIDTDKAVDVVAESLFEHGIVRDAAEVAQIRGQRADSQRQQAEMQQAMATGKALRDTASAVKDSRPDDRGGAS